MKYNNVKKTIIHLLSIIMAISAVVASSLLLWLLCWFRCYSHLRSWGTL